VARSKVAVLAALVGNLLIALAKLAGGLVSGSAAMFAEAAHSFSDVGNQVLLLVGIRRAEGAPTDRHPFGMGKSAYFWPLLVAVLLFGAAGGFSVYEGVRKVVHPHPVESPWSSLTVLGVAFAIESVTLSIAVREARRAADASLRTFLRRNRDATLLTVLVEDGLALAGLPIAAGAVLLSHLTHNGVYDGVGSIVIGLMLMGFALFLGRQVHDLLLGLGLPRADLDRIQDLVAEDPDVVGLREVRSMHLGPSAVLLGAQVELRDGLPSEAAFAALSRLEAALVTGVPVLRYVYLEPAP